MTNFTIGNTKGGQLHLRKLGPGKSSKVEFDVWLKFYNEVGNATYRDTKVLEKTIVFFTIKSYFETSITFPIKKNQNSRVKKKYKTFKLFKKTINER